MKRKLKRSRRSVFGRRKIPSALKAVLWIAVCVVVVAVGYFGAMWASEGGGSKPDSPAADSDVSVGASDSPDDGNNTDDEHVDDGSKPSADTTASTEEIRAFYLPHSALTAENLPTTLTAAYEAGFNAVLFDLKDAEGNLYYRFTNAQANKVGSFTEDALTADALTTLFDVVRECGLLPIPRLYAFCDTRAATVLTDARIVPESNHSWAWYDGDPNNGGKKWLNPYAETAQAYVCALAEELKNKGAAAVMLDGVQFPHQLSGAYLGEEAATVSKDAVLTAFVKKTRTLLGTDCPLLLGCTAESALGTATQVYGGNPLTFGADIASPLLTSKVQESVEKMVLRTQVLEQKPTLAPMLATHGLSAKQISDAVSACVEGGTDSFILYHPEGSYDFASYTLP